MNDMLTEELEALLADETISRQRKAHSHEVLDKRLSLRREARPRLSLRCIREGDGTPAVSAERSAELLRGHWEQAFREQHADPAAVDELLAFVPELRGLDPDFMDFDSFERMVARTANSAPGPDGIPYAFWRCAFALDGVELYQHLAAIWASGLPPAPRPRQLQ